MKAQEYLAKLTKPSPLEIGRAGRCLHTNEGAMIGLSFLGAQVGGVWVMLISTQWLDSNHVLEQGRSF